MIFCDENEADAINHIIDRAQRRANQSGQSQAIVLRAGELAIATARVAFDPLEIVNPQIEI